MRDGRRWYENAATTAQQRMFARFRSAGSELDRKYWVALGLYAVLAVLVWLTMGGGKVFVELPWFDLSEYRFIVVSKPVEMRLIPLIFISGFVLRTVLTRQAEKIRRSGEKDSF